jgi:Holliday junction resolvase RusA-like endonuclease
VKLTIPYEMLRMVRDNERIGGMINGTFVLSRKYRGGKADLRTFALAHARKQRAVCVGPNLPVVVRGMVWWPDRRKRDLTLFVKGLHDALEGVAYDDDKQIVDFHYTLAGIDSANPRLELDVHQQ